MLKSGLILPGFVRATRRIFGPAKAGTISTFTLNRYARVLLSGLVCGHGERLGWNNIIVRLIDRQNTPWNRITEDFLSAIGLEPDFGTPVPASNQGTHWAITELLRALAEYGIGPGQLQELPNLGQKSLDANPHFGRDIQYLTQAQGRELAEIYADDIAKINAHTGARLVPEPLAVLPERPFLPAFRHLPQAILRDFAPAPVHGISSRFIPKPPPPRRALACSNARSVQIYEP